MIILGNSNVELLETFGNELTVVNAARVSFGVQKDEMDTSDTRLLRYLIKNKHWSPLRQVVFRFRLKTCEVTMRQIIKHCIGADWFAPSGAHNMSWNEISGRYKPVLEFYTPEVWRKQSESNKQCSEGEVDTQDQARAIFDRVTSSSIAAYHELLELGVAKEQARFVLPMNQMTWSCFTMSFQAVMNLIELRDKPDSQYEIREVARAMEVLVKEKVPVLYDEWISNV